MPHDADAWTRHMRRGEFDAAWRISDRVLRLRAGVDCSRWPRHEQFVWRGEPLAGRRVLLRCYHGLGDTIQFIRYAPLVSAIDRPMSLRASCVTRDVVATRANSAPPQTIVNTRDPFAGVRKTSISGFP